ncbi:DUF4429 domain-containing protein [Crossiella sp. SN42]|uniref:DUF4429 domain-containing protein n=1 Tax=Crossiella sp. SN42 TaxID=2944808 RepID=UPI00207CF89F|nr:DUF4429 domain-containing protein [Crossiella sp. SN42]MCO1578523.1 DUF4429 domain-containing protein [Crossiella sp. SN42]
MIFGPPSTLQGHDGEAVLHQDAVELHFPRHLSTRQVKSARSPRRVPLSAITDVEYEPEGRYPYLRLRLAGELPGHEPPLPELDVDALVLQPARRAENDAFVAALRAGLSAEPAPEPRLLSPDAHAPGLPRVTGPVDLRVSTLDGVVSLDGQRVVIEFNSTMRKPRRREIAVREIQGVEFVPAKPHRSGLVRFLVPGAELRPDPRRDPHTVRFMAGAEEGRMADLAAELAARLVPAAESVLVAQN